MFNTNFAHNILNVSIATIAGLQASNVTPFFDPVTGAKVVAGLAIAKLVINAARDGVTGMTKPQPPVKKER